MAAYTSSGYAVADIAALKAIAPADRPASGSGIYALAYVSDVQWYEFDPDAVSGGIAPNSGTGRWFAIGREVLRANRTYYVRTDGSDSNDGFTNTSGGAFLTVQKAIDTVASLDISIFDATIKIADGTYTGNIVLKSPLGAGKVIIEGNTSTPTNVVLTNSSDLIFSNGYAGTIRLTGVQVRSTSGNCIYIAGEGVFEWGLVDFNTCSGVHLAIENSVVARLIDAYTISASALIHLYCLGGAFLTLTTVTSKTITITGSPSISIFAYASRTGIIQSGSTYVTFSGAVTGKRYEALENGVIFTGSGVNHFPGTIAGTTATGGQYIA